MATTRNSAGFSPECEVSIPEIDEQHATFFNMLDRIGTVADDLYRPLDDDAVDEVLDIMAEIREHTQNHFGTEEGYMQEVEYPDLDDHKTAHERFLDGIVRMEGELLNGSAVPPIKVRTFLEESCREHILSMDKPFGQFYNKNK
jgi:hemerythrin